MTTKVITTHRVYRCRRCDKRTRRRAELPPGKCSRCGMRLDGEPYTTTTKVREAKR